MSGLRPRPNRRASLTAALCAVLGTALLSASPSTAAQPMNPGERVASAARSPIVTDVNTAWRMTVSIPRQTALKQAVEEFYASGALGAPIRVPQMLSRKLLLGKQVGTECVGRTARGASTWQFVGDWGSSFESPTNRTGAWGDVWRNKQIQLFPATGRDGRGFTAGEVPCISEAITWRSGYQGIVVTSTTVSAPTFAPRALPEQSGASGYVPDQVYRDAMPAPAALAINDLQRFRVVFGPLTQTRNSLIDQGYSNPQISSRSIRVGRLEGGLCGIPSSAAGPAIGYYEFIGDWATQFVANTAWTAATEGIIRINEGASGALSVGQTPCVYQVIRWSSAALGGEVTFESKAGATPNPLPPFVIDVDPEPIPGSEDIVLADFDAPDEDGVEVDPAPLGTDVTVANVVSGVTADYIRGQLANLDQLIAASGAQAGSQGTQDAPQRAADIVADTRVTVQAAQAAVDAGAAEGSISAEEAARLQGDLAALETQLATAAAAVQVRIAGGVVTVTDLAQTVGFDATQSPVAGVRGSGVAHGVTLDIKGPKSVKRGRDAAVRVQVRPSPASGTVRLVILRETNQGIKVAGSKRVPVVKGKATTRIPVAKGAQRSGYSLVAAFTPSNGSRPGVTVLRPIKVS